MGFAPHKICVFVDSNPTIARANYQTICHLVNEKCYANVQD